MIYYRKTLFGSGPKLTAVQVSRCVTMASIGINQPPASTLGLAADNMGQYSCVKY